MKRALCLLTVVALLCTWCLIGPISAAAAAYTDPIFGGEAEIVGTSQSSVAATPAATSAADFKDVPADAWYYHAVDTLVAEGAIHGMTATTFCPDDSITVEQFIKILVGCTVSARVIDSCEDSSGRWSAKYINAAASIGVLDGFAVSAAHLSADITRYEAAWLLVQFAEYLEAEALPANAEIAEEIADYDSIPTTLQETVLQVYTAGLMAGYPNQRFQGNGNLARSEAAAIVLRLLDPSERIETEFSETWETTQEDNSAVVPKSAAVSVDWFSDAVFLGNSMCEGMEMYSGMTKGTFLGETNATVFDILSGDRLRALSSWQFGKIYLILGINEVGVEVDDVIEQYQLLLDQLKELQPNAQIYVHAILPVCEDLLSETQSTYITNFAIRRLNSAIKTLCAEEEVFYLDLYTEFADAAGSLPADLTWDGVQLQAAPYRQWFTYLKTHTTSE